LRPSPLLLATKPNGASPQPDEVYSGDRWLG
jgi:hypothetical protein